ncbi:MAG TPA: hypothetical protein VFY93_16735, partial [Planctomycetota bacterium]|nr:hypothetical protein [Planctomycetota bacterium]
MGTRERRATARDEVRAAVPKMLESMPDGARYSELIDLLQAALPHVNRNTLSGAMFEFSQQPPAEVLKPSRGHYI